MTPHRPPSQQCGSSRRVPGTQGDTGISLVEVVVALFVLAIMALGLLPLLLGSVKVSALNRDLVAANSFANSRLAQLKDAFPDAADTSCATVLARKATNVADPAGTGLKADIDVAACPTYFPDAVLVTVRVRSAIATNPVVVLNSQIVVTKA